jgi:hypothetical protein
MMLRSLRMHPWNTFFAPNWHFGKNKWRDYSYWDKPEYFHDIPQLETWKKWPNNNLVMDPLTRIDEATLACESLIGINYVRSDICRSTSKLTYYITNAGLEFIDRIDHMKNGKPIKTITNSRITELKFPQGKPRYHQKSSFKRKILVALNALLSKFN